jgi:trimeric autotransporter adhesin
MRRFLTLVFLVSLAVPAGVSIVGCTRNPAANYCNGLGYGLKITAVSYIVMQPQTAGISLAYGQTIQAQSPSAFTCKNTSASVSSSSYTYGTTNNQLVDISPTGNICAGTWNRNTGGGIADYTYCYYPNPLPATGGLPYGVAYITAAAQSVTSNPVAVYVHAPVTSINLVGPPGCQSQGTVSQLDAAAYYDLNGTQTQLCGPNSTSVPECETSIGTMNFTVGTSSVATINATTNQITAEQPGTTAITASIAGSGSSAGYFSTCPPASISVTLANGTTSGTIAQGVPQNLTTTVYDTKGQTITGLTLGYQSTNPIDITAGSNGAITTSFPGTASVNAICQPATCNPAPINELGLNGTGLSLSSNPVTITVPGTASDFAWFGAPGQSQYFVPIELTTGTLGSNVRLPYVPNSMMMDRGGNNLYFGSARELMIYSTTTNALTKQDATAPGVVLAVSPNDSQLLINDQSRQVFYLYNATAGGSTTFGGMGAAAAWTPDSQTLYIVDNSELNTPSSCSTPLITGHTDTLYVYNVNTGWTTEPLPPSPLPASMLPTCSTEPNTALPIMAQTPAIMVPGVGAYLRGDPTVAHTWCPTGTVGNNSTIQFYPLGDSEPVQSDVMGATVDGLHILSGSVTGGGGITLNDLALTIPSTTGATSSAGQPILTPMACPVTTTGTSPNQVQTLGALTIHSTYTQATIAGVNAAAVNQVVTGSVPQNTASQTVASNLAFVTYSPLSPSNTNAQLPYYIPAAGTAPGTFNYVTFAGGSAVSAPLVGAFSPDNTIFFVSTAGDNKIHYISIPTTVNASTPPTDTQQVSPNLPACTPVSAGGVDAGCVYSGTGTVVPSTAIEVKPRSVT